MPKRPCLNKGRPGKDGALLFLGVRKGTDWKGRGAAPCPVGGNDSPRTPSMATPKGVPGQGGKRCVASGWRNGRTGAVRAASSVQACAAAPACGGRPLFPLRGISGNREGFSGASGAASEHGRFNRRRQVQRWFEHRRAAGVIQRSEHSGRECVFFSALNRRANRRAWCHGIFSANLLVWWR